MTRSRDLLVLPEGDHEVAAQAALDFVRLSRKQGGALRLIATALLLPCTVGLWTAALTHGIAALIALPATVLLVRNLRQGLRSGRDAMQIELAARLTPPFSAHVVDGRLLLGKPKTPLHTWLSIPITEKQERHIRTLALPAARLHRGPDP
jgi:hypothetical protein